MNRYNKSTTNNGMLSNSRSIGKTCMELSLNLNVSELYFYGSPSGYIFRLDFLSQEPINNKNNINKSSDTILSQGLIRNISNTLININNNDNNDDEINLKIDKTFMPEGSSEFMLDTKKMSYVMNPKNLKEIKNFIKTEAIKKIKDHSLKDSEEESSDSESYSNSFSYSQSSSKSESISEENSKQNKQRIKKPNKSLNQDYYNVNFSQIKFLAYDFKKEALNEVIDTNFTSQVEIKKNENFKKAELEQNFKEIKNQNMDKTHLGIEKFNFENKDENESDALNKAGIMIKQIEYALSKEENQPTIIRMKRTTFIIFIIFISFASVFIVFFLNTLGNIRENTNLIYYSFTLISNTVYALYHARELVLLNNPKYINFFQDRSSYIYNNSQTLINIFSASHDLLTNIITSELTISAENNYILNNSTITTYILEDNLNIKGVQLTLSSAFIESSTALYHIGEKNINDIYPTSIDVYFYIYNSINSIYLGLNKQAGIFLEELGFNIILYPYIFFYLFISVVVIAVTSYFCISNAFFYVEKRKESYLEIFFEIGDEVIRDALERCEAFNKKLQAENNSEEVSNLDEAEIIRDELFIHVQNSKNNRYKTLKKKKNYSNEDENILKYKMIFGFFIISMFYFLMYFYYRLFLTDLGIYLNIYDNVCKEQAYYLTFFNILREYFFDFNSRVLEQNINTYMANAIDDIYKFKMERDNVSLLIEFFNFYINKILLKINF